MKVQEILIENIKCSGCSISILNAQKLMDCVDIVAVDIHKQKVTVNGDYRLERGALVHKLSRLGYPEQGQNNILHRAKSYFSCSTGKFQSSN